MSGPCTTPNASALGVAVDGGATTYFLTFIKIVAGLCATPLPVNAGLAQCQIFEVLPAGSPCSGAPGLADADPEVATTVRTYAAAASSQSVCLLAQLAQPCTSSPQPGWCYVTGANAPTGCQESLDFTSSGTPVAGVTSVLACP